MIWSKIQSFESSFTSRQNYRLNELCEASVVLLGLLHGKKFLTANSLRTNTNSQNSMDVLDDDSFPRIIATFELPGVRTTDLTVQVIDDPHDNTLLISGQRKLYLQRTPGVQACLASRSPSSRGVTSPIIDSAISCHRVRLASELQYGSFSRAVRLPPGIKVCDFIPPAILLTCPE